MRVLAPADCAPLPLPLICHVPAGFPSPAEDFVEGQLDLNEALAPNRTATFYVRSIGDSMINAGIHAGDLLVVDRSLTATDGCVIIACLDGELTVKRLRLRNGRPWLEAANPRYQPIMIAEHAALDVWGVVTTCIHTLR